MRTIQGLTSDSRSNIEEFIKTQLDNQRRRAIVRAEKEQAHNAKAKVSIRGDLRPKPMMNIFTLRPLSSLKIAKNGLMQILGINLT